MRAGLEPNHIFDKPARDEDEDENLTMDSSCMVVKLEIKNSRLRRQNKLSKEELQRQGLVVYKMLSYLVAEK